MLQDGAVAQTDDRIQIQSLKIDENLLHFYDEQQINDLQMYKQKLHDMEVTRISKQRNLIQSVGPHVILETDSQMELGSKSELSNALKDKNF